MAVLTYGNGPSAPLFYPEGTRMLLNWKANRYLSGPTQLTRAGEVLMEIGPDNYESFVAGELARIDGIGAQVAPARANLFLNSTAPVNQNVTVVSGTVYTVSIVGSGSVALSGAGTGVATSGAAVTFTATGTSLAVTVTGSPAYVQVEAGTYASPPIITAGAAVSRPGDILSARVPDGGRAFVFEFDWLEPAAGAGNRRLLSWNSGSSGVDEFALFASASGSLGLAAFSGGYLGEVTSGTPVVSVGRNIGYGVVNSGFLRIGKVGVGDSAARTDLGGPTGLSTLGIGGNGATSDENCFIHARRFTEGPVSEFATPADAFAWAKSIAQGWAA